MNRWNGCGVLSTGVVPHMCGDEPHWVNDDPVLDKSIPPHTRGDDLTILKGVNYARI